mgnify:CR=1 FL=1
MRICIKRVYEAASPDDGERILVDRLWPRGLSKEKAAIDIWEKDVAPQRLENGSDMIRINLMILGTNTEKNLKIIRRPNV